MGAPLKLAVSNIAWPLESELEVARLLERVSITGVEVAPTKIWRRPLEAGEAELRDYRTFWNDHGIEIVALQALLFGRPELTLFDSDERRRATGDYLGGICRIASALGAPTLVFGSPKNRRKGKLPARTADEIAVEFFRAVGEVAVEHDTCLCIEPNPATYGCDFVTTSAAGLALVDAVNHPGFGLHLDAATLTLAGEDPEVAIEHCAGRIRHFHVSEPELGRVGFGSVDHDAVARALRRTDYANWVSLEMRDPGLAVQDEIARATSYLEARYL